MNKQVPILKLSALALFTSIAFSSQAQVASQQYSGVVTDQQGQPVKNARVHIHGRKQYIYTDTEGRFSIQAPQNAELHIAASGYGDQFITTGQPTTLDVQLTSGGIERIVVAASGIHKHNLDMITPVSVLSGDELSRRTEPTIGETLKSQPGVHSNYYGPVAASPVIRGLDGPRVRILNNGLDTADVSRVGPDHAITADAITSEQIEVLRGPATLLYGSGAIGGVVNIVDNRIPRQIRQNAETTVEARYNSVSDEKTGAFNHDGSAEKVAWHFDGFKRKGDDYKVPRFTNSDGENHSRLDNSWIDSQALNAGVSLLGSKGLVGVSVGRLESDYGIPAHSHEHGDHEHEEEHHHDEGVFAKLRQNRASLAAELYNPFSGIETLSFNAAYTDYQHDEIEGSLIGTTFKNKAFESRLTLEHETLFGWHGIVGYHLQQSDYSASGAEAFTPDSDSLSHALFILEEKQFGNVTAQLGARTERVKHDTYGIEFSEHSAEDVSSRFTANSLSAGLVWEFKPGFSWALAISRSERAPSAAELYSNGAHIATRTYELGMAYDIESHAHGDHFHHELAPNRDRFYKEVANNIDLTFRHFEGDLTFTYNFFYNKVKNYLYLANTGLTLEDIAGHDHDNDHGHDHDHAHNHDAFPVYQYQQHDAKLYGLELEVAYNIDNAQSVNVFADAVRAKLDNGSYLPRIPPLKAGAEYHYSAQSWGADIGLTHYAKQDKTAENETATSSYTLLDANINYYFDLQGVDLTAFVRGNNLTNRLGFVHSSFIKEDAPLPGRSVTVGVRARF